MLNFIESIKKQRQEEIREGKNQATTYPLYVVCDITYSYAENIGDYSISTTLKDGVIDDYVYVAEDIEMTEEEFDNYSPKEDDIRREEFSRLRRGHHDRFVICCFTRKAAEEYIKCDRHNLNNPYIYVASVSERNVELRGICQILGDKLPKRKEVKIMQEADCSSIKKPSQEISIAGGVLILSAEISRFTDMLVKICEDKLSPVMVSPSPPSLVRKEEPAREYPPYFLSLNENLDKIYSNLKRIEDFLERVAF